MSVLQSTLKKENKNHLLIFAFIITGFPGTALFGINLKYTITISLLFIYLITNRNCEYLNIYNQDSKKYLRNIFDVAIYLYLSGIVLSSLVSNTNFSASVIYSFLFIFRFLIVKSLTNKIDVIKIFDCLVIALTISSLIGVVFYRPALLLIMKLLQFKLGAIAGNRLLMWGTNANVLGVNLGISSCYIISRLIIDQYKLCKLDITKKGYFQFNSFLGYLILFCNLILLLLCSTRSAYLSMFLGILPLLIRIFSNQLYVSNSYNKYYLLIVSVILLNFKKTFSFLSNFIILQDDLYRGVDSGFTGRVEIWSQISSSIGPLGFGYLPGRVSFDNNFFHSAFLSGLLFAMPIFIFIIYSCIRYTIGFFRTEENLVNNFEYYVKTPLSIFFLINFFLEQQTLGMTSIISYFFLLVPLGIVSKQENKN